MSISKRFSQRCWNIILDNIRMINKFQLKSHEVPPYTTIRSPLNPNKHHWIWMSEAHLSYRKSHKKYIGILQNPSLIILGSDMRATPLLCRMSAGIRSSAITAQAPASSAIFACSLFITSIMTPPRHLKDGDKGELHGKRLTERRLFF